MTMKISVVLPVYNASRTLERCLDSLFAQTGGDIEIILVDDGSTDASSEVYQRYAKDARLLIFKTENRGPSAARNLAIEKATGEYVCFVDADDCLEDGACEILVRTAEKTGADLILYGYKRIIGGKEKIEKIGLPDGIYEREKLAKFCKDFLYKPEHEKIPPYLWLRTVKRSVILESGIEFDPQIKRGEDYLFLALLHRHIQKMAVIAEEHKIYRYYYESGSLTNSYVKGFDTMVLRTYEQLVAFADLDKLDGMLLVRSRLCVMNEIYSASSAKEKRWHIRTIYQNSRVKSAVARYVGRNESCGIPLDFFFMRYSLVSAAYLYHSIRYKMKILLTKLKKWGG